ncbi:MAG TPA: bi-domain-containing oxidoreductase [Pyrinomonadaceae bacterium]|nr:bi-domain-containing oxidoreductase [Pyrinomonadaceae bacterium]
MKQVFRKGLSHIVVAEAPEPMVTPNHVLVNPVYSLISSGTESASIHEGIIKEVAENPSQLRKVWDGMKAMGPVSTIAEVRAKFKEYATLGYAGAGVISERHSTVTEFQAGDRVAYGGEGTGHGQTILASRNLVVRVPDEVPFQHACFTTLGSIALNSIRISEVGVGDVVAVVGLGLVGQLVAQLARLQGARVIGIDLRSDRVALAKKSGVDHGLDGSVSIAEEISAITNGLGADCVIVAAASKSAAPCQLALQICRDRGTIVIVGAVEMQFPWPEMYMKEIRLLMSRAYGPGSYDPEYEVRGHDYPIAYVRWTEKRNMEEFLRLVALGRIDLQSLITHEFNLEDAPQAYRAVMDPASNSLGVLLRYPEPVAVDGSGKAAPQRRVNLKSHSAKSDLKVALVGAGNLARWAHLPSLSKMPNVSLHAVYSASGARGNTYARRFGASYFCTDYKQILEDPQVDVVMVLSRNQHHFSQAYEALMAGKHVFVEKPMALTEADCRQLYNAVAVSGNQLTVGFNRRFAPFYKELKNSLRGRTGPAVINCRMSSPGISGSYWMADPSIGGAILGEAVHFVDLMYWLLESEPISVSAYCLPTGKTDPIGENNMVATFRFADGSIGSLNYTTVGSKRAQGELVEVFAKGVSSSVEDFKRFKSVSNFKHTKSTWWAHKGYEAQLSSFFGCLARGESPEITVRDGARATLVCVEMLRSAQTLTSRDINLDELLTGETQLFVS